MKDITSPQINTSKIQINSDLSIGSFHQSFDLGGLSVVICGSPQLTGDRYADDLHDAPYQVQHGG